MAVRQRTESAFRDKIPSPMRRDLVVRRMAMITHRHPFFLGSTWREKLAQMKGTGFSPYVNQAELKWSLAPEGCFSGFSLTIRSFFGSLCKPPKKYRLARNTY
jgi:hypothetical protein